MASRPGHHQRRPALRVPDRRAGTERPHDRRLGPDGEDRDHRRARRRPTWRVACRTRPACRRRSVSSAARSTRATPGSASPAEAMWMPRVSASYLLGERTVLKGGYGVYYDTLTAADYFAAQAGYSVTTTSTISDDLGRTFKWATPATGSASFDPFPVRANGTRWDPIVGDTLGAQHRPRRRAVTRKTACARMRASNGGVRRCSASSRRISASSSPTRVPSVTVCPSASAATICRSRTGTAATRATPPRTPS